MDFTRKQSVLCIRGKLLRTFGSFSTYGAWTETKNSKYFMLEVRMTPCDHSTRHTESSELCLKKSQASQL